MPTSPKFNLRLPPDLQAEAVAQAQAAGVSLNAWLTLGVRNWVSYKRQEFQQVAARPVDPPHRPPPPQAVSGTEPERSALPLASPEVPKVGRNQLCPCGSGRKFKKCHGRPQPTA